MQKFLLFLLVLFFAGAMVILGAQDLRRSYPQRSSASEPSSPMARGSAWLGDLFKPTEAQEGSNEKRGRFLEALSGDVRPQAGVSVPAQYAGQPVVESSKGGLLDWFQSRYRSNSETTPPKEKTPTKPSTYNANGAKGVGVNTATQHDDLGRSDRQELGELIETLE